MLKIKIKATGQIIEVKDFSRIIIDEENEEIRELRLNEVEFIEDDKEDEKTIRMFSLKNVENMIISIDFGHKDDVAVETIFRKDKNGLTILSQKVISRADDFNTEEKRNNYLNKNNNDKRLLSPK